MRVHSAVITAPLAPPSCLTHSFTVSGTRFAARPPISGKADVGEGRQGKGRGMGEMKCVMVGRRRFGACGNEGSLEYVWMCGKEGSLEHVERKAAKCDWRR